MINETSRVLFKQDYRNALDVQTLRSSIAGHRKLVFSNPDVSLELVPDVCDALFGQNSQLLKLEMSMFLPDSQALSALLAALKLHRPRLVEVDLSIHFDEGQIKRRSAEVTLDLMAAISEWPSLQTLKLRTYGEDVHRRRANGRKWLERHEGEAFSIDDRVLTGFSQLKNLSIDCSDVGLTAELLSQFHLALPAIETIEKIETSDPAARGWIKVPKPHSM